MNKKLLAFAFACVLGACAEADLTHRGDAPSVASQANFVPIATMSMAQMDGAH